MNSSEIPARIGHHRAIRHTTSANTAGRTPLLMPLAGLLTWPQSHDQNGRYTAEVNTEIRTISIAASTHSKGKHKWNMCILTYLLPSCSYTLHTGRLHIKRPQMPTGLRGREVDNSPLDVLISNNGLSRQLCSLILPHWPLAWISPLKTIHT